MIGLLRISGPVGPFESFETLQNIRGSCQASRDSTPEAACTSLEAIPEMALDTGRAAVSPKPQLMDHLTQSYDCRLILLLLMNVTVL